MHKKNGLIKRGLQIIIIIKDLLLLSNGLLLDFWVKIIDIANYFQNKLSTKSQ